MVAQTPPPHQGSSRDLRNFWRSVRSGGDVARAGLVSRIMLTNPDLEVKISLHVYPIGTR
jgi:hypothetical protein